MPLDLNKLAKKYDVPPEVLINQMKKMLSNPKEFDEMIQKFSYLMVQHQNR